VAIRLTESALRKIVSEEMRSFYRRPLRESAMGGKEIFYVATNDMDRMTQTISGGDVRGSIMGALGGTAVTRGRGVFAFSDESLAEREAMAEPLRVEVNTAGFIDCDSGYMKVVNALMATQNQSCETVADKLSADLSPPEIARFIVTDCSKIVPGVVFTSRKDGRGVVVFRVERMTAAM
jgi:hypothetical protein